MSIHNFSWVVPQKLAGCGIPDFSLPGTAAWLAENGVDILVSHVVPYGGDINGICSEHGIEWVYFPIVDFNVPTNVNAYLELITKITTAMKTDRGVCVHCHAGIGRTGMTLACALGKYLQLSPSDAIAAIRKARPPSIETFEQEMFIQKFLGAQA